MALKVQLAMPSQHLCTRSCRKFIQLARGLRQKKNRVERVEFGSRATSPEVLDVGSTALRQEGLRCLEKVMKILEIASSANLSSARGNLGDSLAAAQELLEGCVEIAVSDWLSRSSQALAKPLPERKLPTGSLPVGCTCSLGKSSEQLQIVFWKLLDSMDTNRDKRQPQSSFFASVVEQARRLLRPNRIICFQGSWPELLENLERLEEFKGFSIFPPRDWDGYEDLSDKAP